MMHIDENDYISMLHNLGRECIGALRITTDDETYDEEYIPVTGQEIEQLAAEGATKSTEIVTKTHLSLAGASGKVGLYYDENSDKWYLPTGTAPSTHIVKQSHVRLSGIVANERLSMLAAAKCGIDTAESFIINTGSAAEEEVLYATKRYDRIITDGSRRIGALPRPDRCHQEDFAQALGLPSSRKYEKEDDHYLSQMFKILREYYDYFEKKCPRAKIIRNSDIPERFIYTEKGFEHGELPSHYNHYYYAYVSNLIADMIS